MKREACGCQVDPRVIEPKVPCETHKAMLRPYHVIPAKVTGFPQGGYQVVGWLDQVRLVQNRGRGGERGVGEKADDSAGSTV